MQPKTTPRREAAEAVLNQQMQELAEMISRSQLAAGLGQSFDGKRDLYNSCGYKKAPTVTDYWNVYERGDLGSILLTAEPEETWAVTPILREEREGMTRKAVRARGGTDRTPFEQAWEDLNEEQGLRGLFCAADTLAGIGEFGVILLGLRDGKTLAEPVEPGSAKGLQYTRALSQRVATINTWDTDPASPRFGLPLTYSLVNADAEGPTIAGTAVHWSRIVHVRLELITESRVYALPRLQRVLNRLYDLDKTLGGSAEAFWMAVFGGVAFKADPNAKLDTTALDTEIQKWVHGLQRYMKLKGVDVQSLSPSVQNPQGLFGVIVDILSAVLRMPKRIFMGSERGELASSQDERAWARRLRARRRLWAAPDVVRPFARRLIEAGVLPEPDGAWWVDWGAGEEAEEERTGQERVAETTARVTAMAAYLSGGVDALMSPRDFLIHEMGYEEWEADEMLENAAAVAAEQAGQEAAEAPPPEEPPPAAPPGKRPGEGGEGAEPGTGKGGGAGGEEQPPFPAENADPEDEDEIDDTPRRPDGAYTEQGGLKADGRFTGGPASVGLRTRKGETE